MEIFRVLIFWRCENYILAQLVEESGVYPNRKYSYDKRGNLKSVLRGGELIRGYEYDTSDRLGLSYDFSGRAKNYIYDRLGNRIASCIIQSVESK